MCFELSHYLNVGYITEVSEVYYASTVVDSEEGSSTHVQKRLQHSSRCVTTEKQIQHIK
jgi:hypothetical protein